MGENGLEDYGVVEFVRPGKAIIRSIRDNKSIALPYGTYRNDMPAEVGEQVTFIRSQSLKKLDGFIAEDVQLDTTKPAQFIARLLRREKKNEKEGYNDGDWYIVNAGSEREYALDNSLGTFVKNFCEGDYVWANVDVESGKAVSISDAATHGLNIYGVWISDMSDSTRRHVYNLSSGKYISAGEVTDFPLIKEKDDDWGGLVRCMLHPTRKAFPSTIVPIPDCDLPPEIDIGYNGKIKNIQRSFAYAHISVESVSRIFLPSDLFGMWMKDINEGLEMLCGIIQEEKGSRAVYVRPPEFRWTLDHAVNQNMCSRRREA